MKVRRGRQEGARQAGEAEIEWKGSKGGGRLARGKAKREREVLEGDKGGRDRAGAS